MNCSCCGTEITADMYSGGLCFSCGTPLAESEKNFDKNKELAQAEQAFRKKEAAEQKKRQIEEQIENHMLTTGLSYEGFTIVKYLGLVSGDTIIGTGFISTWDAALSDLFGVEATEYSKKIKAAKEKAISDMINASVKKGGNAIIGISFDVSSFSGNLIGVSVNGTSVIIKESVSTNDL